MSNIQDLVTGDTPENRSDAMLEMIFSMIQEANEMHAEMLVASTNGDHAVFDDYNKLSQLDTHIEAIATMRNVGKHRLHLHYYKQ
jgi:hypothetical protein